MHVRSHSPRHYSQSVVIPAKTSPPAWLLAVLGLGLGLVSQVASAAPEDVVEHVPAGIVADDDAGTGVFRQADGTWTAYVVFNGSLSKLKGQESKAQADTDYDSFLEEFAKVVKQRIKDEPDGESKQRLIALSTLDLLHRDTTRLPKEQRLRFMLALAGEPSDVSILWRVCRGLHDLTDDFFDDRQAQLEILEHAMEVGERVLGFSEHNMNSQRWFHLSCYHFLDTRTFLCRINLRDPALTSEDRTKLRDEMQQLAEQKEQLKPTIMQFREAEFDN